MRYVLSLNVKFHTKKVIVLVVEHLSLHSKRIVYCSFFFLFKYYSSNKFYVTHEIQVIVEKLYTVKHVIRWAYHFSFWTHFNNLSNLLREVYIFKVSTTKLS